MQKIATTQQLQAELQSLLAYAKTAQPSRKVLASALRELAARVMPRTARGDTKGITKALESEGWQHGEDFWFEGDDMRVKDKSTGKQISDWINDSGSDYAWSAGRKTEVSHETGEWTVK